VCSVAFGMYLKVVATALMAQSRRPQRCHVASPQDYPPVSAAGHARTDTTESSAQATAGLIARTKAGNILPARRRRSLDVF